MRDKFVAAVAAIHGDGHGGKGQTRQTHRIGLVAPFSGKELSSEVVQPVSLVVPDLLDETFRLLPVIEDGVAALLQTEAVVGTLVYVEEGY